MKLFPILKTPQLSNIRGVTLLECCEVAPGNENQGQLCSGTLTVLFHRISYN